MNNAHNSSKKKGERVPNWLRILIPFSILAAVTNILSVIFQEEFRATRNMWWAGLNVIFSVGIVLLAAYALFRWRHRSTDKAAINGLLKTLDQVLIQQRSPILFLVIATFILAGGSALIAVPLSLIFGDGEADLFIASSLGLISIAIAFLAMHYAFQAERAASKLVLERGHFIEGFDAFIKRITIELERVNKKIHDKELKEGSIYLIKCIYLTPFLGHAALREEDTEHLGFFRDHIDVIEKLLGSERCRISILTLDPDSLIRWYAHVEWIEEAKKTNGAYTSERLVEMSNSVKSSLTKHKGFGKVEIGTEKVPGFTIKCRKWLNENYLGEKKKRLGIATGPDLPFQMCLATKAPYSALDKWPKVDSVEDETPDFAILSLVGSNTYKSLINAIMEDRIPYPYGGGGIEYILDRLHNVIYTVDSEFCKIVNRHYQQLFNDSSLDDTIEQWEYPRIFWNEWNNIERYGLPGG